MSTIKSLKPTLFICLFVLGCSSPKTDSNITRESKKNFRELASLELDFSNEQLALNSCFDNSRDICYNASPYDGLTQGMFESTEDFQNRELDLYKTYEGCVANKSTSCALDNGREDLASIITRNNHERVVNKKNLKEMDWFFLSPRKIKRFISFTKKLAKVRDKIKSNAKKLSSTGKKITLKALHGQGVGVRGSYFGIEGRSFSAEAMILNQQLSIYCAPGIQYVTDIGGELGFTKSFAKSCNSSKEYEGQFLTVSGAVSSESLGLPISYEGSYSFGFDTFSLTKSLKEKTQEGLFYPNIALSEYYVLKQVLATQLKELNLSQSEKHALGLVTKLGMEMLTPAGTNINFQGVLSEVSVKKIMATFNSSVGNEAKKVLLSQSFQNLLLKYKLKNLRVLTQQIAAALSGCDAISAAISASATISPVSLGVGLTSYSSLLEIDLDKLLTLKNISSFALLNPLLMDTYAIGKVIEFAILIEDLPGVVDNKCFNNEYKDIIETFSLVNTL